MSKPLFVGYLALSSLFISPAVLACSPEPGASATPLEERMDSTALVFAAEVVAMEENTVMLSVKERFKGDVPQEIKVDGFNSHTCSTYLSLGDKALFFVKGDKEQGYSAVYDGAFGTTLPLNKETRQRIEKNKLQNTTLDKQNCAAVFDGRRLFVPCVKIAGSEDVYKVQLKLAGRGPGLGFELAYFNKHPKPAPKPPVNSGSGGIQPFYAEVEALDIQLMESMPLQVSAKVDGYLRNGCEKLMPYGDEAILPNREGHFHIALTVNPPEADVACTDAITPFSVNVPLDVYGLPAGIYTVDVNRKLKADFELAQDNVLPDENTPNSPEQPPKPDADENKPNPPEPPAKPDAEKPLPPAGDENKPNPPEQLPKPDGDKPLPPVGDENQPKPPQQPPKPEGKVPPEPVEEKPEIQPVEAPADIKPL